MELRSNRAKGASSAEGADAASSSAGGQNAHKRKTRSAPKNTDFAPAVDHAEGTSEDGPAVVVEEDDGDAPYNLIGSVHSKNLTGMVIFLTACMAAFMITIAVIYEA